MSFQDVASGVEVDYLVTVTLAPTYTGTMEQVRVSVIA